MKQDIMVNVALTVVPRADGVVLLEKKEEELCQFAFELKAKKLPYPEHHVHRALEEMFEHLLVRMRSAGMVRP